MLIRAAAVNVVPVLFTPDSPGKVHIFLHHGDSLCMQGAEISVLEDADEVSFGSLLKSDQCLRLEAEIVVIASSDLSYKPLERCSAEA